MSTIHKPPIRAEKKITAAAHAKLLPVTDNSIPFNAAIKQGTPMDLADYGYLEEEYLVSGMANVYSMGPTREDNTYIKAEDCPYTDRILVRKPQSPEDFSGSVLVELMNYAFLMDNPEAGWGALHPYLLSHGDAWVGITIRDCAIRTLKQYDPARYQALSHPNPIPPEERGRVGIAYNFKVDPDSENGIFYDVISQVGALIKSDHLDNPFAGYQVCHTYVTGASAGDLTTYAGFVHNYAMLSDGKPIYDGIQIFMTGAPANLNNEEPNVVVPDPRCIIDPCVPTFRILTMGDILGKGFHPDWGFMQRKEQSDDPVYRIYEIPTETLGVPGPVDTMMNLADAERAGARWFDKTAQYIEDAVSTQGILQKAFESLKKYCESGILPPDSMLLETTGEYPDVDFVYDDNGKAKGGVLC